jgi:hypothetical protein
MNLNEYNNMNTITKYNIKKLINYP